MTQYNIIYQAAILTISDKASKGERQDSVTPILISTLTNANIQVVIKNVIPDESSIISDTLIRYTDQMGLDLIITSGGTGLSPRDVTPEATSSIAERNVPGLVEAMRIKSLKHTPYAMLSRSLAVIRKKTLIVNLPGSPKAAEECLKIILPVLKHGLDKIRGDSKDCAKK